MPNIKVKYIIDENGDRVAPVTHIDAVRDSSGNGLSDLMVPEKLGSGIGTCSTSSGTALTVSLTGYELVQNGFVAVTFSNDVPSGATLNVNGKGAKPIIYKGSAIESDTIKADDTVTFGYDGTNYVVTSLGGGGGSVVFPEFVTIQLTSTEGTSDPNLIGTTIVVTNNTTSESILSTTWQGTDIVAQIPDGVSYTVTAGSISEYTIYENTKTGTAVSGRSILAKFDYIGYTVDLGLPSGILWCTRNVGASSPEDFGLYFSWGNVVGHTENSGYNFNQTNYNNTSGKALTGDISVGVTYDAARAIMGSKWEMPTADDFRELKNNTDVISATINGVPGVKFMKKTDNSVYMFWPYTGAYNETTLEGKGSYVVQWCRTYNNTTQGIQYYIGNPHGDVIRTNIPDYNQSQRYGGNSIRAIKS